MLIVDSVFDGHGRKDALLQIDVEVERGMGPSISFHADFEAVNSLNPHPQLKAEAARRSL